MPRGRPHFALWLGLLLTCLTSAGPRAPAASSRLDPVTLVERAARVVVEAHRTEQLPVRVVEQVSPREVPAFEGLVVARTRRLFLEHGALLN